MVGIALAVVCGMLVAATGLFSFGFFISAALFFLLVSFYSRHSGWSVWPVLATAGLLAACRFMSALPDNSFLEKHVGTESVQLIGRIIGDPSFYSYPSGRGRTCSLTLICEGISSNGEWIKIPGTLDVAIRNIPLGFPSERGDRVMISGRIGKKLFPGRNSLEINVSEPLHYEYLSSARIMLPVRWGRNWREKAAGRLEMGMAEFPDQSAVLKALVLGYREGIPPEHLNRFKRTGSLHIFAISGLHVGIVGLLIMIVLKAVGVPRDRFWFWLLPLLALYVISTGMKSSALRALMMAAVFILSPMFRRKPDIPVSIAAAAILILLFQPLEILSAGFIFSFSVVICIVMIYSVVPKSWISGNWIKSYIRSLIITSVAASLASIPLAALYFGTFSPVSLIGNLIVVPLTFFIVVSGWLSILIPWTAEVFNYASVVFIDVLLRSVEWLDAIPHSSRAVSVPPISALLLWFGSLIYLFTHARSVNQRCYAIAAAACAAVLALIG